MASQIPIEFQHLFFYEPVHCVLICPSCKMAIGKERVKRHLKERHTMTRKERKTLATALALLPIIDKEDGFPRPEHHSEPIRGLDILDPFKCNDCNFISRSKVMMRRHEHPETNPSIVEPNPIIVDLNVRQQWQLVKVQHWTTSGKGLRYWIVKSDVDIWAMSNAHRNDGRNEDCTMEALS